MGLLIIGMPYAFLVEEKGVLNPLWKGSNVDVAARLKLGLVSIGGLLHNGEGVVCHDPRSGCCDDLLL